MKTASEIRAAMALPNVRAMQRVIREGETDQTDGAYYRVNGRPSLTSLDRHPYHGIPTTRGARASGAYQHLGTTWARIAERYPVDCATFEPPAQDFASVVGMEDRGALADVIAGRLEQAIAKLRPEWTSLPGAAENSARYTMDRAREVFRRYGGVLASESDTQPPAPIEERGVPYQPEEADMPMPLIAPLLIGLAGELIKAFSPLAQEKIAATLDRHTKDPAVSQAVAKSLVDKAVELTGVADPVEAVVVAKKDPAVVAAAERFTLDELEKLGPLVDRLHAMEKESWGAEEASRAAAADRARDEAHDLAQPLLYAALIAVGLFIVFICVVIGIRVSQGKDPGTELWATLTGLVGWSTAMAQMIYAYRFGTSRQSAGKDVLIGQLSTMKSSRPSV